MGMERLELSRSYDHSALNATCLPVSPHPQKLVREYFSDQKIIINLNILLTNFYFLSCGKLTGYSS